MKKRHPLLILIISFLSIISCNTNPGSEQSSKKEITSGDKECIDRIIALDDSLGKRRNHACESISLSQTIQQYTEEIKKLDFHNCPDEFTYTVKRHQYAWVDMMQVTDHYPELRGEMHNLFDSIKSGKDSIEFNTRLNAIWRTWEEIEKTVAEKK